MTEQIPKHHGHPDVPRPGNAELVDLARQICHAIEACGASHELTHAVTLASNLVFYLQKPVGVSGFSFGRAIEALKSGQCVARAGWNGKGMWLVLVPGTPKAELREGSPYRAASGLESCEILPHIDMWTVNAEGRRAMLPGWVASQTDMLAEDWTIV